MVARFIYWLWSLLVTSQRFWESVNGGGIVIFVGPNGSGKSAVMVESTLPTLDGMRWECYDLDHRHSRPFLEHAASCVQCTPEGVRVQRPKTAADLAYAGLCDEGLSTLLACSSGERLVYSTVPLTGEDGHPHPRFRPITEFRDLLRIEHADVLFDEVAGIADASGSAAIPVQVTNWQHQLRKRDIRQRVTTPAYARCALPIRQVAQVVVECRSFFPVPRRGDAALWRPRRIVRAVAYDAWDFEDYTASEGQRTKLKPLAKGLLWIPTARSIRTYNTFGQVLQLGHVTEAGMCVNCGGTRSRPKCGCGDDGGLMLDHVTVMTEVTASGARVKRAVGVSDQD